ncbi:Alpha-(1,3)-fucosyltransferase 7, partial [Halocaridina rubra]
PFVSFATTLVKEAVNTSEIPITGNTHKPNENILSNTKNVQHATTTKVQETSVDSYEVMPIREPGDSNFPFEDKRTPRVFNTSVDIFKEIPRELDPRNPNNPPLKKILFWNDAYGQKHFGFGFGQEPFHRAGCRVKTCMTTGNRNRFPLEEFDAVIWHFRSNDKSLPSYRSPHTRYVFWMMESASHLYGNIKQYNGTFNWTFTYRLDSDFPNPYGKVYRRHEPLPMTHVDLSKKTKFAAWFVSNCATIGGRRSFIDTLEKWIDIDIYGACGALKCDRKDQWSTCYKMLEKDYKFYFSFENSLCKDYATEKFFNILKLNIIPVVYGLGSYHLQAPPHSYINALNFPSAKALADYLLYLSKNQTAYEEYFQWKRFHYQPTQWEKVARPWCQLCEQLHIDNTKNVYDLHKWFVEDSKCKTRSSPEIHKLISE